MSTIPRIAAAAARMKGEAAFQVLARARALEAEGKNIIHLEIGQPDFKTPNHIIEEGMASLKRGDTGYAPTLGLPALRQAIATRESRLRGYNVDASCVAVVPGAKTAILLSMAATLEPGDEIICPDPAFPAYENIATYLGAILRPLPLLESKDFSFSRDVFASLVTDKTRMVILNSPSNPTGGLIPKDDIEFIASLAKEKGFMVLSDEIYNELCFTGEVAPSIYDVPGMHDYTYVANGLSKTFAMTGWRLGYIIAPPAAMSAIEMLSVNFFSCTATFTQYAAIEAMKNTEDVIAMRDSYHKRCTYVVDALNSIPGVTCRMPGGAFYAFPNITSFGKTSAEIAEYLLTEAGVALLPGTAFGPHGEGYLRISYATAQDKLEEAIARIRKALAEL